MPKIEFVPTFGEKQNAKLKQRIAFDWLRDTRQIRLMGLHH